MPGGWLAITLCIIVALAIAGLALTWLPAMAVKPRELKELRTHVQGKLALTYDDGPGPLLTPPLVELLDRHNVRASFFLVGFRALRFPQMCNLLSSSGHHLGCHTQMHKKPWKVWPWQTASDLEQGYRSMAQWLPANASFRPPFGKLTLWSWLAAKRRGAPLSWWTHDGGDTHQQLPDPAAVARSIINDGGGVVLLHSHDRGPERQEYVLNITEQLLIGAKEKGLTLCTMQDLVGDHPSNDSSGGPHGRQA